MKRSILLVAAAAASIISCKSNLAGTSAPELPEAVNFGTYVPYTRTAAITSSNIADFGVYAFYSPSGGWDDGLVPDFMFDQKVEGSAAAGFSYAPIKYWPKNEGETISFFAYAPYKSDSNGISEQSLPSSAGAPQISYSLPDDEASQVDLLCAAPALARTAFDGQVSFSFSHVLSRIGVSVKTDASVLSGGSAIYLNSVSIEAGFPSSGVLSLGDGSWSNVQAGALRTYLRDLGSTESGLAVGTSEYPVFSGDDFVMCIPSDDLSLGLTVTYTLVTPDPALASGKSVLVHTVELSTSIDDTSGKTHTIVLNISPEAVTFGVPTVSEWEDA